MTQERRGEVEAMGAHLGFWLRFVSNQVSGRFGALLEREGTSVAEWVALSTLAARQEASHAALIQLLGMTKGATSKLLTRLEERGLVERRLAPGSARDQVLHLTAAGRRLVPRLAKLADENEQHFFGHLAPARREALAEAFRDLVDHHGMTQVPLG